MHPEQWPRVESIFHNALRIPLTQRDSFVRSECADDQCLYAEIISLLRSHKAQSLLDHGASSIAADWLLATTHKLRAGNRTGPYEISGEIGRGGMGAVYRAKDTRLDRDVALKFVWEASTDGSELFPQFDQEVRAASALNHPNIITIHDIGSAEGLPYIACEFVDGVTLRERLSRGRLDLDEVLHVGLQVSRGTRGGPRRRNCSSRYKAGKHHDPARRVGEGPRFWRGDINQGGSHGRWRVRIGYTPLHVARATTRRTSRRAKRYLQPGPVAVRDDNGLQAELAMTLVEVPSDLHDVLSRSVAADPGERYASGGEMKAALEKVASGRPHPQRNLASRVWLALGVLTTLTAGLFAFLLTRPTTTSAYYSAVPLTSKSGAQLCPSFAPDGEGVAFSWDGERQGNFDIYVKQIGGGAPLRLTSDPRPDVSPTWSPDGRSIAFIRLSPDDTGEVLLIPPLSGGRERRLAQVRAPYPDYRNLRLLAWSPDGKWLAVPDANSSGAPQEPFGPGIRSGISLLSMETGEKRKLTVPPATYDDFEPAFSPDGTRLAFVRHAGPSAGDVYVLEIPQQTQVRGEPKRLTSDHRPNSSPVWMHDGRSLLFARYHLPGRHSLWRITLSSTPHLEPLPVSADDASALALSARGDRLLYTRQMNNSNLWAVEVPASEAIGQARVVPRQWSISSRQDLTPSFSPMASKSLFNQRARDGTRSGWRIGIARMCVR